MYLLLIYKRQNIADIKPAATAVNTNPVIPSGMYCATNMPPKKAEAIPANGYFNGIPFF